MKKLIISMIVFICLILYCSSPGKNNTIDYSNDSITQNQQENSKPLSPNDKNLEISKPKNINKEAPNINKESSKPLIKTYYVLKDVRTFKNGFNQYCRKSKFPFRLTNVNINKGEVNNTFQYMFNKNIGILGTINKTDDSLKEITMIGQGDGSLNSGLNIILTMGGIISSLQPNLSPKQRGEILKELGFLDSKMDIMNLEGNTRRGNLKYWINSNKYTGLMFGTSNVNNY